MSLAGGTESLVNEEPSQSKRRERYARRGEETGTDLLRDIGINEGLVYERWLTFCKRVGRIDKERSHDQTSL